MKDFISLSDLAPTFLEVAGFKPVSTMTARSFVDVLTAGASGRVDLKRHQVFTGKERDVPSQEKGMGGYPTHAIRTHDFLYIRNFRPDRWPVGAPGQHTIQYNDIDESPTKTYMIEHRHDRKVKKLFDLAFGKRPGEELYDLRKDPRQLHNVADQAEYAEVKSQLATALMAELTATKDPRVLGEGDAFDHYPYYGGYPGGRKPESLEAHDRLHE